MIMPPLPEPFPAGYIAQTEYFYTADQMKAYGQACRADLIALVQSVHKAKGRYHSQIAMCNLYDACNLPNTRPTK